MSIPTQFEWLVNESGPKMIKEALSLYGVEELLGPNNNPVILTWATHLGKNILGGEYTEDVTPWCGLFMAYVAFKAGKHIVHQPLWALNWINFGVENQVENAMLGDVLVFRRKTDEGTIAGHVGLYVAEDDQCFHVLGGNQNDSVCITRKPKSDLLKCRRPDYIDMPNNIRKVFVDPSGVIGTLA